MTVKMDPAQEILSNAMRHQNPMNEVIGQGDSPVQQFYNGTTVFMTGGSGYMGKHLIEKLFRSSAIKKMYLLLRSKKGKTINERLQGTLGDPVYDMLREKQPHFADRIVALEGDVANIRLGLNDEDWTKITQEVNVIFHAAATVRFDETLRVATMINVRGTRESLTLAQACQNLKSYVYLSTAYTGAIQKHLDKDLYEQFYPSPVSPELLISLVDQLDEDRMNGISAKFIAGWPNTYVFTKTVAEEQIRTTAKNLPIAVVRPPVVLPAYYEPLPGWTDMSAATSLSGLLLAVLLGVLHLLRCNKDTYLPGTPVDYVNNAIIAAGWDAQQRRNMGDTDIPIYTVSNEKNFIHFDLIVKRLRANVKLCTDKAVYMCGFIQCRSDWDYWLLSWLLHYIPAYILDAVCAVIGKRPAGIKSFVAIYQKIDKMISLYDFFITHKWNYRDDNVQAMFARMSDADRAIYNCNLSTIDQEEYIIIWGLGLRKYVIKDGLTNTNLGYKKQLILTVLNYVLLSVYAYILYCILFYSFNVVKYTLYLCL